MFRIFVIFMFGALILNIIPLPERSDSQIGSTTLTPSNHICPNYELTKNYKLRSGDEIAQNLQESVEAVGINFGFSAYFAPRGIYPVGPETFVIESNSKTIIDFGIYYIGGMGDELNIRFLALMDERQLNIPDTSSVPPYHDIAIHPKDASLFSFELPPLEPGIHDLVILGIPDIATIPLLGDMTNIMSLTRRLTLVVGDETTSPATEHPYTFMPATVTKSAFDGDYLFGFHVDDSRLWWSYPEQSLVVLPGQTFNFNIKTGYLGSPPQTDMEYIAMVLFEDYQQISFTDASKVLYIELNQDTAYTQIPVTLTTPIQPGRHDIIAFRITNPGTPRCIQLSVPEGSAHWYQVVGDRVSINVQE